MNIRNGIKKKYTLLAAAIISTVLSLLFAVLAIYAAYSLSFVTMGIYLGISSLSFCGAPLLYYFSAKLRLKDKYKDAQTCLTECGAEKMSAEEGNGEAENGEA